MLKLQKRGKTKRTEKKNNGQERKEKFAKRNEIKRNYF